MTAKRTVVRTRMAGAASAMPPLVKSLKTVGLYPRELQVALSNELIELLSSQLYQSPVKAVEELVVNSYDADARECRVFVPFADDPREFVAVYDNGIGMDYDGLVDLWHIGRSSKTKDEVQKRAGRKFIGKFGIGKLATYSLAGHVTYITRHEGQILYVWLDFSRFKPSADGTSEPVKLQVHVVEKVSDFAELPLVRAVCDALGVKSKALADGPKSKSWTMCVLEELKPKAATLKPPHLKWVLSTAMPLKADFSLSLNGKKVVSAKAAQDPVVSFAVTELPSTRLKALAKPSDDARGVKWRKQGNKLVSDTFPEGVQGTVVVTKSTLYGGKSADLERSHGFFVRVRDRLVAETDALFGLHPLSYEIFNRFRAELTANDLHASLVATREGFEETEMLVEFRRLLGEVFNEARDRYKSIQEEWTRDEVNKKERDRDYMAPRLVDHPVADVLSSGNLSGGAEADEGWFYLNVSPGDDVKGAIRDLYGGKRGAYRFTHSSLGRDQRMATFNPISREFVLNTDHELVREYASDPRAAELLTDLVAAEALLEVYLRENAVPRQIAGDILERRDSLFRNLAKDHAYAVAAIASSLRESAAVERDLEMALVAAARALGFVATHVGGEGQPDGLAEFNDHSVGPRKITLEAKSSGTVPSLGALDIAGVEQHMRDKSAQGALLVSPGYPGATRGENSALSNRVRAAKISCWTVEQLARVVEEAEARHINATQVLQIVQSAFTPDEVSTAVGKLLENPSWQMRHLYRAVIEALRELEDRLPGTPRTIDMIAGEVSRSQVFARITKAEIQKAVQDLSHASLGGLTAAQESVIMHVSYDELDRRVNALTASPSRSRRPSTFRKK